MQPERPGFHETCLSCGRDLHACVNCRFYRRGARWDCAETIESPVPDKERRNLCDWYETDPRRLVEAEGDRKGQSAQEKARSDFDRIFGGG
jgi:hypothetical protein